MAACIDQPHQLLWALAEHHLRLATTSDRPHSYLVATFRALEAVLVGNIVTPRTEALTRCRIAELLIIHATPDNAEAAGRHLVKAALLARGPTMLDLDMLVRDLQCDVELWSGSGTKTVRNALKAAADEAARAGLRRWYYHFALRRAHLHAQDGDISGCHSILLAAASAAGTYGDLDVQAFLLIALVHALLKAQATSLAAEPMNLLKGMFEVTVVLPPVTTDLEPTATVHPPSPPLVQHEHLRIYYDVTAIIYSLHIGATEAARTHLPDLHSLVENPSASTEAELDAGSARVLLLGNDPTVATPLSLQVAVLPRAYLLALIFLVSGLVHRFSDTVKARLHLIEGLKAVEKEVSREKAAHLPTAGPPPSMNVWLLELKILLLRHLAEVTIRRGELSDAFKVMMKLMEWTRSDPILWEKYRALVYFKWALLNLAAKRVGSARAWLQKATHAGNREIAFLAKAHMVLMVFVSEPPDVADATNSMRELQTELQVSASHANVGSAGFGALLELAAGVGFIVAGNIRETKCSLLECIKQNTSLGCPELRYISVGLLGDLFYGLDAPRAEKMAMTAYTMARKAHCDVWAGACAHSLAALAPEGTKKGEFETKAKEHEMLVQAASDSVGALMDAWEASPGAADLLRPILLTLSILGGLPLPFLKDLAWVKSKKYETALWGYRPVERPSTPYPTRYCWAFERPCFDYSQSPSADRSSVLWQLFIQILGWLATALALVQTFLHRSFQQPAIYSGIAAIATIFGCYLTYVFSECTLDLIKKTEGDKTAKLGPPIYLSAAATVLILIAAATYWIEFRIVQKLQVVLLLKKKDDKGHGAHGGHDTHAAAVVVHDTHHV